MGFIEAGPARRCADLSADERRRQALACFARYFGPEAESPTHYVDKVWADDEWARGCYVANPSPGAWTDFGHHLRRPIGRIHWAGTETATVWNGYIDGAIQAGERAADEVLAASRDQAR
jgi:monoamine oxidase